MPSREEMWNALSTQASSGKEYDLLVVGGGINGAGIARDAAMRGLSVAVVEMTDLAYGTSSRSSKLVHGGLRYLEQYEFGLVFESVSERGVLLNLAPHLVSPLPFVFPIYEGARKNVHLINLGLWLYDALSLFRSPKIHRLLSPSKVREVEPTLRQTGLTGAPLYYDAATDDARLTLETALDATRLGAHIATWAKAERFFRDAKGRVRGAIVRDQLTGKTIPVRARAVVNATGPWIDATLRNRRELLRPTKGIHVVVDHDRLPIRQALACFHPEDHRVLFAVPWGDRTYLGTTDTDYEGDPAHVAATGEDVDYLLKVANFYYPESRLTRDDVISTWAGLRPLIAPKNSDVDESSVSREHELLEREDGLLTIAGGKLTTYRLMSAEVVDAAVAQLRRNFRGQYNDRKLNRTATHVPLPGAYRAGQDAHSLAQVLKSESESRLSDATCLHLAQTYGELARHIARICATDPSAADPLVPGRPEVMGQVDYAVQQELAGRLMDVVTRRTQLYYRDTSQGLDASERIADRMAQHLGWTPDRRREEIESYEAEVALSREWKADRPATAPLHAVVGAKAPLSAAAQNRTEREAFDAPVRAQ